MKLYSYIIKRVLVSLLTLFGVILITFIITRSLPGDVVFLRLPERASLEDYLAEKERLGLDKPILVQFIIYIGDLFTGNWGYSYAYRAEYHVWDLIMTHLPRSLELIFISMIIAIILGVLLGKISAMHRNGFKDITIRTFTYIFVSIPGFVIVIFFMQLYVFTPLKIFPLYGYKTTGYPEPPLITGIRSFDCLLSGQWYLFIDYIWHIIVPVSAMIIIQMVIIIRQTRSSIIEALQMDYVQLAMVKGHEEKTIVKKHIMKNILAPIITSAGMQFPIVLGGMVAVEIIYNIDGMGSLIQNAVSRSDYPMIIALIFVFSLCVIISNFIVDIIIVLIDPRIKLK